MSEQYITTPPESIAVIGMTGRFPKAKNLDEYWQRLRDGIECISFFSKDDSASSDEYEVPSDPNFVNAGAVLEDIDLFDAPFFGFSARDAEVMDPQQRLFLECAWQSLEDAAYNPETYPGLIGIFAGCALSSYVFDLYGNSEALGFVDDFQVGIGNDKDHLTTQVSYKLNLRGPSMAVQTACSTSLVAVCMACQSLLNYQCDIALAGGIAVDNSTAAGYFYEPGGILSPDGHCRVFDASAKGTVPGNGVGIVVLKRLSEALADRDHIYAVVKGSALNNDGSLKVGYTAPSVDGQAQVIAMAQALARVSPETITYIEAHGTGTPLGDPIELAALSQVFRARTKRKGFCALGAVKSNIGHLDTAAGIAGFIKTVLALQHKLLPPSLHFRQPNPKIDFAGGPFYVNTKLSEWKSDGHPRRAGVSSFGIGGTNAHVILEEAPALERSQHSRPCCLLTISARTGEALETTTDDLIDYLAQYPATDVTNVAYSYQVGRKAFTHRRAVLCRSLDAHDVKSALEKRDPQQLFSDVSASKERPIIFMFPGQSTQHIDMALQVYKIEATFRAEVDGCCEFLRQELQMDLRDLLFPAAEKRDEAARELARTSFTQAALFTIEYALAKLWMEWGVRPSAMIGHSIGEYVAACLAGVLSLKDALALVAKRGQFMEQMPAGSMLAVPLSESAAQKYLGNGLCLAAVNGPASCVLSGPTDAVSRVAEELSENGMRCHRLNTSHAFHSNLMDPIETPFVRCVMAVKLKPPQIPYISNVTGSWATADAVADPSYWGRQLRATVRFGDGLQTLLSIPDCILLEAGPGQTLSNLARQQPGRGARQVAFSSLSSGRGAQGDIPSLLTTLGKLWLGGVDVNWKGFYRHDKCRRIPLPTYPFERQRYWIGASASQATSAELDPAPVKQELEFYYPCWKPAVRLEPFLEDRPHAGRWLVFGGSEELASESIRRLREHSDQVTHVTAGEQFARFNAGIYSIRPAERVDYETLLQELAIRSELPDEIVHLWMLASPEGGSDRDVFEGIQKLGFYSLVSLCQALEKARLRKPIRITIVSSQIHGVSGNEPLCPAKATVLGACKVISQEYPNIRCRAVDIDLSELAESELVEHLLWELTVARFEPVVAYRKGRRWIQTFEAVQLEDAAEGVSSLRRSGVYLITGGLGKIGLVLAECLARTARAKLVLTGRSAFPERSEWEQRLKDDGASALSYKIRKLLELEELGSEIMVFSADSADTERMRGVIEAAEIRLGAICGVIHAAGDTTESCSVRQLDRDAADRQFRPKAAGLFALTELLEGRDLDFVLLLSSLAAQLGGTELAAYAAANNFLDAVATQRNREGRVPWISVNWDGWYFPAEGELDQDEASDANDLILPEEGEAAFLNILDRAPCQIIVSASDLRARVDRWIKFKGDPVHRESQDYEESTQHPRPELANAYVAPRSPIEMSVAEIWQELLGVSPIGAFDNFFELGGHSLRAIQVISRLRETFGIEFPLERLFEAPTISETAETIQEMQIMPDTESETAQLLELVEQLSDAQVTALLKMSKDSSYQEGMPRA
jgi:acyl transferase domain-containing protein